MLASSIVVVFLLINSCCLLSASGEQQTSCSREKNVDVNEIEEGSYLGSVQNSYISYGLKSENVEITLNVSLELKTSQYTGMIFYVGGSKKDFYGLYLRDHDLQVSYHCDGYLNSYSVRVPVNDGKWHKLQFTSNGTRTELIIDENVYTGRTLGCKNPTLISPYYFGSVDKVHFEMAKSHLENHNKPFVGCMRNFVISQADTPTLSGVIPCRTHAESGMAFSGMGSYAIVDENFEFGGVHPNLRMEFKSKTDDGILLFYKTKTGKEYLLLQLIEGLVRLTVSNGDGPHSTTFNCSNTLNFCDGKWHKISVAKNKNVHVLTVDSKTAPPIFYYGTNYISEGSGPLYLGGIPTTYAGVGYQYIGCIRNLEINGKQDDLFTYKRTRNVTVNLCT